MTKVSAGADKGDIVPECVHCTRGGLTGPGRWPTLLTHKLFISKPAVPARPPSRNPSLTAIASPADARRWTRRKAARPQELVAAALELFVERGFAATRLEDVAAAAGVSKGTVYLYFANKEELFKTVVRENMIPALMKGVDLVDSYEGSTPELLRELLLGWWGLIGATPVAGLTKLIMAESGNFPDIAQFYQNEVIEPGERLFARVLERGAARGEFRPLPANPCTTLFCAPLVYLMIWQRAFSNVSCEPIDPNAFVDQLLHMLLFGVTTGPARDTALPPPSGPFIWERIRDELLAEKAAADARTGTDAT
ncbi:TetR family transcriptional regulator [Cupriavidus plantarum]|uniref:TetR family transcriptional regulator n=1 Tax=Cupriavidus plantarum TaxID=942865 RepID=A0A316FKW4_9BURK|nr:TetR family transcriptional regulator [Cupriavidus plantarum]REE91933.1 TetR family transcriptional regulator [Cupriavidus plantarum]